MEIDFNVENVRILKSKYIIDSGFDRGRNDTLIIRKVFLKIFKCCLDTKCIGWIVNSNELWIFDIKNNNSGENNTNNKIIDLIKNEGLIIYKWGDSNEIWTRLSNINSYSEEIEINKNSVISWIENSLKLYIMCTIRHIIPEYLYILPYGSGLIHLENFHKSNSNSTFNYYTITGKLNINSNIFYFGISKFFVKLRHIDIKEIDIENKNNYNQVVIFPWARIIGVLVGIENKEPLPGLVVAWNNAIGKNIFSRSVQFAKLKVNCLRGEKESIWYIPLSLVYLFDFPEIESIYSNWLKMRNYRITLDLFNYNSRKRKIDRLDGDSAIHRVSSKPRFSDNPSIHYSGDEFPNIINEDSKSSIQQDLDISKSLSSSESEFESETETEYDPFKSSDSENELEPNELEIKNHSFPEHWLSITDNIISTDENIQYILRNSFNGSNMNNIRKGLRTKELLKSPFPIDNNFFNNFALNYNNDNNLCYELISNIFSVISNSENFDIFDLDFEEIKTHVLLLIKDKESIKDKSLLLNNNNESIRDNTLLLNKNKESIKTNSLLLNKNKESNFDNDSLQVSLLVKSGENDINISCDKLNRWSFYNLFPEKNIDCKFHLACPNENLLDVSLLVVREICSTYATANLGSLSPRNGTFIMNNGNHDDFISLLPGIENIDSFSQSCERCASELLYEQEIPLVIFLINPFSKSDISFEEFEKKCVQPFYKSCSSNIYVQILDSDMLHASIQFNLERIAFSIFTRAQERYELLELNEEYGKIPSLKMPNSLIYSVNFLETLNSSKKENYTFDKSMKKLGLVLIDNHFQTLHICYYTSLNLNYILVCILTKDSKDSASFVFPSNSFRGIALQERIINVIIKVLTIKLSKKEYDNRLIYIVSLCDNYIDPLKSQWKNIFNTNTRISNLKFKILNSFILKCNSIARIPRNDYKNGIFSVCNLEFHISCDFQIIRGTRNNDNDDKRDVDYTKTCKDLTRELLITSFIPFERVLKDSRKDFFEPNYLTVGNPIIDAFPRHIAIISAQIALFSII